MGDTSDLVVVSLVRNDIIQAIKDYGFGPTELAELAGVHRCVVQRILAETQPKVARSTVGKLLEAILVLQFEKRTPVRRRFAGRVGNRGHQRTWTQCSRGHEFTPENTYVDSQGRRRCRICLARTRRAYRLKVKENDGTPTPRSSR